jgi:hypothetical protein
MKRLSSLESGSPDPALAACCAVVVAILLSASGCATGTSAAVASTYGKASVYRSATAYVDLAPGDAFKPAVELLLGRKDIKITDLVEANTRCTAIMGDRSLTFRVVESGPDRCRLSILVGGGDNPEANQELADQLMQNICRHLGAACE